MIRSTHIWHFRHQLDVISFFDGINTLSAECVYYLSHTFPLSPKNGHDIVIRHIFCLLRLAKNAWLLDLYFGISPKIGQKRYRLPTDGDHLPNQPDNVADIVCTVWVFFDAASGILLDTILIYHPMQR